MDASKSRRKWNISFKLKLCEESKTRSISSVCREHNISRKSLQIWRKQAEKLKNCPNRTTRSRLMPDLALSASKGAKHPELETQLLKWIMDERAQKHAVGGLFIRTTAMRIANELNIDSFNASNGWLCRFLNRSGLSLRSIVTNGKSLPKDGKKIVLDHIENVNHHILSNNINKSSFVNFDETTIYLEMPSNSNYDSTGPNTVKMFPDGAEKRRLSVIFSAAADGSKLKPVILVPSLSPLENFITPDNLIVSYLPTATFNQETIKSEFIDKVLIPYKMANNLYNMICLLDQAPDHITECIKSPLRGNNIEPLFIPTRMTNLLQPANVGWMRPLKLRFKQMWEEWMQIGVHTYTSDGNIKSPDYQQAINWISIIWKEFEAATIEKSFEYCGIFESNPSNFHPALKDYLETESIDRVVERDGADEIIGFNQDVNDYDDDPNGNVSSASAKAPEVGSQEINDYEEVFSSLNSIFGQETITQPVQQPAVQATTSSTLSITPTNSNNQNSGNSAQKRTSKRKEAQKEKESFKGEFYGKGTFHFQDGSIYEGEMMDGKKHGQGTCHYKNGDKYTGHWVNNKRDGKGEYTFKNGNIFKGDFENDQIITSFNLA